jgi:hypothetical protein
MGHSITIENYTFPDNIYTIDITYNLSEMYSLALKNIWKEELHLWDFLHWKKLKDVKDVLIELRNELEQNPTLYKKYNPKNWWGSYNWLLRNLNILIVASNESPNSIVHDFY